MNKKMISFITAIALITSVFAGMAAVNAEAAEKVYNFSELTEASYSKNGASVFEGAIGLSAAEGMKPYSVNLAAASPKGDTLSFTSALKSKKIKVTTELKAGETMVVYYCGSDSAGAAAKALDMQITDAGGNVVATETNAENKALKPYTIFCKADKAGTYSAVDTSSGTNRTVIYAVAVTDGEYNPSAGDATVPPATVNPDVTPDPNATPEPTPTPKPTVNPNAVSQVEIKRAEGWLESAFVMWTNTTAVDKYNVYVKPEGGEYTKIDDELVRRYPGYYRADAMGLKAGKYQIKIAAVLGGEEKDVKETEVLDVKAQIREGYAFDPKSVNYNADGIGGYKMDGTVKDNAKIIYLTDKNKDTVKADIVTDTGKGTVTACTGLAEILSAREKNKAETTPLIIRMIGQVKSPAGKNSAGYMQIKGTSNITFEGVGSDATTFNWSFLLRETNNVEVRNLAVMEFYDDGISLDTNNFNDWVHNCDIFYGQNRGGDQKKGDGSLDVKSGSDYCTFSYNHFWDSGKSSLCGMKADSYKGYHITYHHNWFDHSDSRHPRVRGDIVHIYNNYYDGNSKYGAGSTTGSNLFVESNVFRNCKYPVLISMQGSDVAGGNTGTFSGEDGGMIKMFGNIIYGGYSVINAKDAPVEFDAYVADVRDEQVPDTYKAKQGNSVYNNFDTAADMYAYTPMSAEDVAVNVKTYAGRVENGDFTHQFNDAVDDELYDRDPVLGDALQSYKTTLAAEYATSSEYPATTEGAVPTAKPTAAPIDTSAQPTSKPSGEGGGTVSKNTVIWRASDTGKNANDGDALKDGWLSLVGEGASYSATNKTIGGVSFTGKMAGTTNSPSLDKIKSGEISGAVLKITPSKDGSVKVYFKLNSNKTFYITDSEGTVLESHANTGESSEYTTLLADVTAGTVYYAFGDGTKSEYWGVEYTSEGGFADDDNEEPSAPSETPTPTPSGPTAHAPSETPTPASDTCVKIIAEYEDGNLKSLKTEKNVKISDATETGSENIKIFYWYSLESMKPVK